MRGMYPFILGKLRKEVPLAKCMKTSHLAHDDLKRLFLLYFTFLVRLQGFIPSLELFEPRLSQCDAVSIQLSFSKYTDSCIVLLQLIIDLNQSFDGTCALVLHKFQFLVVQSFSVCMTSPSLTAK